MRGKLAALALGLGLLAGPALAYEPLAYPGSTWGTVSRDFADPRSTWKDLTREEPGLEGYGTQGTVKQGVTWLRLPADIDVNTFGAYRWRFRSKNRPYYNEQGPALSLEFNKSFLDFGLDFSWQRYPELRETSDQYELFLGWYKRIDLVGEGGTSVLGVPIRGVPFKTWGRLAHDLHGLEGDTTQGWVNQGVEWLEVPGIKAVFKTYAAYRWRLRDKNRRFYNVHGPAVGLELSRGPFDLGVEHGWRRYPQLDRSQRTLEVSLTWYFGWDLKKL